jgi:hypothetical protein
MYFIQFYPIMMIKIRYATCVLHTPPSTSGPPPPIPQHTVEARAGRGKVECRDRVSKSIHACKQSPSQTPINEQATYDMQHTLGSTSISSWLSCGRYAQQRAPPPRSCHAIRFGTCLFVRSLMAAADKTSGRAGGGAEGDIGWRGAEPWIERVMSKNGGWPCTCVRRRRGERGRRRRRSDLEKIL